MRAAVILMATAIASSASALQVDGIPVRGRIHDVSVADIRSAIRAVKDAVSQVVVLNADQMRVFLEPTELGWLAVRRAQFARTPIDRTHPKWWINGFGVDDPQVLQFMRTADELYIFPMRTPDKPHRDNKHMRPLDKQARRILVRLLADRRQWYQGAYNMIIVEPEPRNIGLLFRRDLNELVLFFSRSFTSSAGLITGSFNGHHVVGMLEDGPGHKLEEWSSRFAKPELAGR